jgi:hypothetical protein
MEKIIVDIWGGVNSQDWVARFVRDEADAVELAMQELRNGFLVNLRSDADFGSYEEFDNRTARVQ